MSFVMAGIKEVYIAASGAFPSVLTDVTGLGIRNNGAFAITFIKEMRDKNGRAFPNMINFRAEVSTMQINDITGLKRLVTAAKGSDCAAAVVTSGVVKGGTSPYYVDAQTGGVYKFESGNGIGIDFELNLGMNTRELKIILERAFKYDGAVSPAAGTGNKIISDAQTAQVPFTTDKLPMIDETKVVTGFLSLPFLSSLTATLQTAFADIYLNDFTCTLKTKSTKNGFNKSLVSGFQVELTGEASGPDVPVLKDAFKYDAPSGNITVYLDAPTNSKSLVFGGHGLTRIGMADLNDEKRSVKLTYSGEYDADFVAQNTNDITFYSFLQ